MKQLKTLQYKFEKVITEEITVFATISIDLVNKEYEIIQETNTQNAINLDKALAKLKVEIYDFIDNLFKHDSYHYKLENFIKEDENLKSILISLKSKDSRQDDYRYLKQKMIDFAMEANKFI